jgi:hypothetical protein
MTRSTVRSAGVDRLAQHLLNGVDDALMSDEFGAWLAESLRFRAFANANRDKIRKKLRTAGDEAARADVRAELDVARSLLDDRRIELAFEPRGSTGGGPDFAVTYRGHHAFDLEVTRPRHPLDRDGVGATVLVKLRQLPKSVANVILIVGHEADASRVDIGAAVRAIRARADAKDEAYFARRGFQGTRQFYDRFLRLGAVLLWNGSGGDQRTTSWRNASARIAVPEPAVATVVGLLEDNRHKGAV